MRLVILESPFEGNVGRNLQYLRACMRDSIGRGEAPFASHGLYTQPGVLSDADAAERELGISAGFAWRAAADYTVAYHDLGFSSGMRAGINHALEFGQIVLYRQLGGEWAELSEARRRDHG